MAMNRMQDNIVTAAKLADVALAAFVRSALVSPQEARLGMAMAMIASCRDAQEVRDLAASFANLCAAHADPRVQAARAKGGTA